MEVRGHKYVWAPYDSFICVSTAHIFSSVAFNQYIYIQLYAAGTSPPRTIARICKSFNIISLEMTPEAMQLGLLEVCVVTTVLLQCGRNID